MISYLSTLALVLSVASGVHSHPDPEKPKTPEQYRVYQDLQAAAYHCAPAVAAYTAERKQAFAQQVLGGVPNGKTLTASDLFTEGSYEDSTEQKLLSCHDASDLKIRNNTCVLGTLMSIS